MDTLDDSDNAPPSSLRTAVFCLWASVIFLFFFSLMLWIANPSILSVIIDLVNLGIMVILVTKISSGRNWARWIFTLLWLAGISIIGTSLLTEAKVFFSGPVIYLISGAIQSTLQTISVVLIFTKASNEWFQKISALRKSQ